MDTSVKADTAWQSGRFDATSGPQRLLFGEMYEDAEIEVSAFRGKRRIFCIASAGSTAWRLAAEHDVVACDINPTQLAYAERRVKGGRHELGDAERAMRFVGSFMALVGWRRELVATFLSLSDPHEQPMFWHTHLDTRRFRAGFDLLLSRVLLRAIYAPRFLAILPSHFGRVVRRRFERGFARHANSTNPYPRMLFLGEGSTGPYIPPKTIEFVLADAAAYLESCPMRSFDGFALSNILDGAESSYAARLFNAVRHAAAPDAVVVLRSFAEPASLSDSNRAECDRSMLWGIVDVRSAHL
ncbi:MAG TPA: hypothetical protein VLV86_03060 [Vicinamibacterales bacterium]|nr:hypothetical protein [Vicinamibacterales bacterium]